MFFYQRKDAGCGRTCKPSGARKHARMTTLAKRRGRSTYIHLLALARAQTPGFPGASGSFWELLGPSGSFRELLGASGSLRELPGAPGSCSAGLLRPPEPSRVSQVPPQMATQIPRAVHHSFKTAHSGPKTSQGAHKRPQEDLKSTPKKASRGTNCNPPFSL